ncbi:MAG: hypothetical protein OXT65_05745 [Alphaproteobacteria bacterium]|nr:hypothetical protein [Alphaproteobacteria bacterium]
MSNLEKFKGAIAWKGLKSLEFRVFGWMFKGMLFVFMLTYIAAGLWGTRNWLQLKIVRMHDLGRLEVMLAEAQNAEDMDDISSWLRARPLSESSYILSAMRPHIHKMPSFYVIDLIRRSHHISDDEQKKFWTMMMRFRLQYDSMRCGLGDVQKTLHGVIDLLYTAAAISEQNVLVDIGTTEAMDVTMDVLAFDAKQPAQNDPTETCIMIANMTPEIEKYSLVPKQEWANLRFALRYGTEQSINAEKVRLEREKLKPRVSAGPQTPIPAQDDTTE